MVAVGTQRGLSVRGFGVEAPETAHRMRVYPNPCVLNAENPDRRVVIDSLPGDAWSVRVYTLAGLPVAVLGVDPSLHRAVWNPTGSPSGIYLLMVSGPRGAKTERVALVRP
jgi:hypothetical protein